jgi:hypothetical protein
MAAGQLRPGHSSHEPSHGGGRGGVLTFSDLEPVSGFEPLTCRLQEARPSAACASCTNGTRHRTDGTRCAGLSRAPFHEPFHADGRQWFVTVTERSDRKPSQRHLNLTTRSNRTVGQDRTGHRLGPLRCRRARRRRWCSRGRGRFKGLNEGSTQPWSRPRNEANSDRGTNA